MKKLFVIIFALATLAASVEAQVSVRRTAKKEKAETTSAKPARKVGTPAKKETAPAKKEVVAVDSEAAPIKKTTVAEKKRATTRIESESMVDNNSLRRQLFDQNQPRPTNDARWQHVIYRELDLEKDANAALYYPQEPVDGLTNFFQIIFEAMLNGKLKAYEYLDGREVFSEKYLVKIEDVLTTHQIDFTTTTDRTGKTVYQVEQSDIPSHLVKSYYIKEKWEVDKNTSQFRPHIVAICPVLHNLGDIGSNITRYPLFWLDFADLRPFINAQLVMTAEMNTAHRYTLDDFFALGLYKGDIYKVQNPRGLTLMQQYPDPDTLRMKREEIEAQLQNFGKSIYPKEPEVTEEPQEKPRGRSRKEDIAREKEERAAMAEELVREDEKEGRQTKGWNIGKKNRRTKQEVEEKNDSIDDVSYYSVRRLK